MTIPKTILFRGGIVVDHREAAEKDLLIRGESVIACGNLAGQSADEEVDARSLLILPGAVDPHVHFNDEFMGTVSVHNFEKGTRAAAFGGVTSLIDFSNQAPGESLVHALERKQDEALGEALVDWGVHPVITRPDSVTLAEIPKITALGAPSVKCYMTYKSEGLMIGERDLIRIAENLRSVNGMLLLHAEDNEMIETGTAKQIESGRTLPIFHAHSRPPEAENRAIESCLRVGRRTGAKLFIVHLASDKGLDMITAAQKEGVRIACETCTHYLIFDRSMLEREDGIKWICSPPLRTTEIRDRLWSGVQDGRIALVSSDDAAYSWEAKQYGRERFDKCPNGIPGIEVRVNLLFSEGVAKGRLSLSRWVELISTRPAEIFGLAPKKGHLEPGSDADIILFDPKEKWTMGGDTLHMAADWSAYEDIPVTGRIRRVYSRGELIIEEGECRADKGRGRYLHRRLPA